ncbi:DNA cytosine methyltransferase [Pantoea ananatis]|uniref:DNA cytosine methyltransferase n=1 Tax=Pantoea ananas TaxID=553 RepID=UPI003019CEDC
MTAYYNEFDPFAAQWLRKLIDAGLIAPGVVDDRSITDVTPSDLKGFTQCHFFAGVGGWSYALRLASVPDFFPCWTGSPPCQPFSTAGKQLGQLDERHLAPTFMRLVAQCRPAVLFGEQVAAAISKHWLDDLFLELENENYTCGAAVLPACSVGAPHKRDRLFFGAALMDHASSIGRHARRHRDNNGHDGQQPAAAGKNGCMAHHCDGGLQRQRENCDSQGWQGSDICQAGLCNRAWAGAVAQPMRSERNSKRLSGSRESIEAQSCGQTAELAGCSDTRKPAGEDFSHHWANADWLGCRDGRFRPVEPGTFPLANGIPSRVGRLRGYGNAIVPQVAAEFITAFMAASVEAVA